MGAMVRNIVILGAGKFGQRAITAFSAKAAQTEVVVVDRRPPENLPPSVVRVQAEAVAWLVSHQGDMRSKTILIPAVPLHLAADWLVKHAAAAGLTISAVPLGEELLSGMPNGFRLGSNKAAASHADFRCPDNCPEPEALCTVTGRERPPPLYELLEELLTPFYVPLVLRSRQYAPGVGGYEVGELRRLYRRVKDSASRQVAVATACKCHGIVDTFTVL